MSVPGIVKQFLGLQMRPIMFPTSPTQIASTISNGTSTSIEPKPIVMLTGEMEFPTPIHPSKTWNQDRQAPTAPLCMGDSESTERPRTPISPKTVEKMAREDDRKRMKSPSRNGPGIVPRKRGRPRIYGTDRQNDELEKKLAEVQKAAEAPLETTDSDDLSEITDGTKRRKYAPKPAKDDPKYLDMRRANNEAVKRNRDKAKRLQMLKDQELERLRQMVIELEKELLSEKERVKMLNTRIDTYTQIISSLSLSKNGVPSGS